MNVHFPFYLAELSSQSSYAGTSRSHIPGRPPVKPILDRSPSPGGSPSSPVRTCILARINCTGISRFDEYHHRPINVETISYPDNYQFLTTDSRGEFRFIEPKEQLPTVSYKSTGAYIGILDHEGIFHGLYNLLRTRIKVINNYVQTLSKMSLSECQEFPDGEVCSVFDVRS